MRQSPGASAPDGQSVGGRLRYLRGKRGLTQTALAVRSGLSTSFVSRLESGQRRLLRRADLYALAEALQVAPAELTGRAEAAQDPVRQQSMAATLDLRRALLAPADVATRPIDQVGADVAGMVEARLRADFATMARRLPGLIDECRAGVREAGHEGDRQRWLHLLVTALYMAVMQGKALSVPDLAALASDQQRGVATQIEAPLWRAVEQTCRSMLWTTINLRHQALPLARDTVDQVDALIDTAGGPAAEVAGMAHIAAATAAAALRNTTLATEHIAESARIGARVGAGSNVFGLNYSGPIVRTWAVWMAAEAGEPGRIRELVRGIDLSALPAVQRSSMWLDAARGLAHLRGEAHRAAAALRMAEAAGPQRVRAHNLTRETIAALLPNVRDPEHRDYLLGLAQRCGLNG